MKIQGYYVKRIGANEFVGTDSASGYPYWTDFFGHATRYNKIVDADRMAKILKEQYEIVQAEVAFTSIDNVTVQQQRSDEILAEARRKFSEPELKALRDALLGEGNEADWIKSLKRIPDPDNKFTDEEVCQGLDLQAKRISELEQAIKRIEEAANAPIKIVWDSGSKTPPVVQGLEKLLKEVEDAAKMVEDV